MGECVLAKKLWEICRDAKDAAHVTNQHIADETGLALNTVSQYLRGDTKHPSVYTVGPICRACSVDLNAYFNIKIPSEKNPDDCSACTELAHAEQMQRIYERGLRVRSVTIMGLCVILVLALVVLIIDLCNPNVGWVRA
nr:MAG TPA: Regulatory protein-modification, helix-turn-helix, transcriptional regulato, DNA [Caudoviricetes sp.]